VNSKLKEKLLQICDIEGDSEKVGWRKRRDAMENWINDHVIEHETELSVVNPKVFTSDMLDFVKEKLTEQAAEELTTYTRYDIKKNKIKAKIIVLKENK
jgi:hypothetical protein